MPTWGQLLGEIKTRIQGGDLQAVDLQLSSQILRPFLVKLIEDTKEI